MKTLVGTLAIMLACIPTLPAQPQHPRNSRVGHQRAERDITPGQAGPAPRVLATYVLGDITEKDLDRVAGIELARVRMQEYELETKLIRQIVSERLLRFEALKERKSRDQLYAERVTNRIVEPSSKRIAAFLKKYGPHMKGTEREKRQKIVAALQQQQIRTLENQLQASLLRGANLKVEVQPPRFPIPITSSDPTLGPEKAPVTIVELTDFQCPYCARAASTLRTLLKRYGSSLRLVFKAAPSPSHPRGVPAAEAAFCAGAQGHFWPFYDWAFAHQNDLSDAAMTAEATALGLDTAKFRACLSSHAMLPMVRAGQRLAREAGIEGTPTFFINGYMVAGAQPMSTFEALIHEELRATRHTDTKGSTNTAHPSHAGSTRTRHTSR